MTLVAEPHPVATDSAPLSAPAGTTPGAPAGAPPVDPRVNPHLRLVDGKERALHPFRSRTYDELRAVQNVSFDVREGEFFGIVGRNGSGKSTLLKCLGAIYGIDHGRLAVAGRLSRPMSFAAASRSIHVIRRSRPRKGWTRARVCAA